MGKEQHKYNVSKTCVLKVVMHCECNCCMKKINDAVREIALSEGVEMADLVVETAEVIVVGRTDPEKLCCLLQQLTQKHVKIETQTTVFEEDTPASEQIKNRVFQTPESPGRRTVEWHRHLPCDDAERPATAGDGHMEVPGLTLRSTHVPLGDTFPWRARRVGCVRA